MRIKQSVAFRVVALTSLIVILALFSSRTKADTGTCSGVTITLPYTDVMGNVFFCQIAEAFFSGLTSGTTATTYSPAQTVTREQMAAFTSRTMDQTLKRGSRRAVAKKWWTPQSANAVNTTDIGANPQQVEFDGTDLWVTNYSANTVMRIRPGDGKLLGTWTGASSAVCIVAAMGRIFITGGPVPGSLYMIDPTQPAGPVTTLTSALGNGPDGIAFDGSRIWTANFGGSVSIISFNPTSVTTVSAGFVQLSGILFDGANIWVVDTGDAAIKKLNSNGSIAQSIGVGFSSPPLYPGFDGTNIWLPKLNSNSVIVVRVKDTVGNPLPAGFVLATLTGNGLTNPIAAAFDGERMMITNVGGTNVSLWKAADLAPLGSFSAGFAPLGACSDGLNFWIVLNGANKLARF